MVGFKGTNLIFDSGLMGGVHCPTDLVRKFPGMRLSAVALQAFLDFFPESGRLLHAYRRRGGFGIDG